MLGEFNYSFFAEKVSVCVMLGASREKGCLIKEQWFFSVKEK